MKRVFVVGGTGFLGYHAIQEFLSKGWSVTALGLPPDHPSDSSVSSSDHGLYPATLK